MSIIKTHNITLYGGTDDIDIVLRPLCDEHFPLLYKWNADPEVLYWTEGGKDIVRSYDANTVHRIYGGVSQNAHCFLIEVDGMPIGECWLQRMNLPDITAMYPGLDVRRIDMMIGEKTYWNRGIGTAFIGMLVDFAFCNQHADVLHCFCEDYNRRSQRMWQKHGFTLVRTDDLPQPQKGKTQFHYALTRAEFISRRRRPVPAEARFELPLLDLQPSQLHISEGKLRLTREWFDPDDRSAFDPISVKLYGGRYLMTDGHTRAVLAYQHGWQTVPVTWDNDALDMLAYAENVKWCNKEGICSIADLAHRIVSPKDYEKLWRKRCMDMEIPPSFAAIAARWCCLDGRDRMLIVTDGEMRGIAESIQADSAPFVKGIDLIDLDEIGDCNNMTDLSAAMSRLLPSDLLLVNIGCESFITKGRGRTFSAFDKPENVRAKYAFIRPTITREALLEGLNTPQNLPHDITRQYAAIRRGSCLHVTACGGTDMTFRVKSSETVTYETPEAGGACYLPPAEMSFGIDEGSANGVIVVDVTVGELRVHADLVDRLGLVDGPVTISVHNGEIIEIAGGDMAARLRDKLFCLPDTCRRVVELGIGLSRMMPTGIIGIDESIASTCHFGIGNDLGFGGTNDAPIHLDVVVQSPTIRLV